MSRSPLRYQPRFELRSGLIDKVRHVFVARAHSTMRFSIFALVTFAACATPVTRPPLLDPSNPAAPEAPLPIIGAAEDAHVAPVDPGTPSPAERSTPTAGRYVCPMHAEVTLDSPGKCPKCGMALVPRSQ